MSGGPPINASTHDPLSGLVPTAVHQVVPVVEQVCMARDTYRLRLRCPEVAEQIVPGQFFMVRVPGTTDPLLGRPFALYDVYDEDSRPAGVDFAYTVVGKLTSLMTRWKPGTPVEIWGPLGNGFPIPQGHVMCVAGGIGQTPFLAVAREALGLRSYGSRRVRAKATRVTLCYGVRTAELLAGVDDFQACGVDLQIATDDGTCGHHGFVTDLLRDALRGPNRPDAVYCCGPHPMMKASQALCIAENVPCWLSLESPMACGFGACFSCVVKVKIASGEWDYRRSCVAGPVFPAERLVLD